jgi:hypothetical protein
MIQYESNSDFHIQHQTSTVSISLNLMLRQIKVDITEQYEFDFENDLIINYVHGQLSQRVSLIKMLGLLDSQTYASELRHLAVSSSRARARLECIKQLVSADGIDEVERLAKKNNSSALVQSCLSLTEKVGSLS